MNTQIVGGYKHFRIYQSQDLTGTTFFGVAGSAIIGTTAKEIINLLKSK